MRLAKIAGIAVIALVIAGLIYWHEIKDDSKKPPANNVQQAPPVTVGVAKSQDVPVVVEGLGTVQASNRVNVTTRVSGQITQVFFREGQEVQAGAPLFQIDPRQYQAALQQAQATKEKDEAQLQSAQLDLQRYSQLLPSGFQTRQGYDQQRATVAQLQATVKADQAQIESAQINVDYSLIRSPIAGRTGQRVVDLGNFVQTGQNSSLVTIAQIKPIYVSFNVPAERLDEIRKNQGKSPLKVIAFAMDDRTALSDGNLTLIDNQVDTTTGTVHLKAEFANTNESLWPGEPVNAHLILATRENAVTVPAQTVMQGPSGAYVYVLSNDNIAKRQPVNVAATQSGIAVIGSGLQTGERVVVDGQYRVTDGSKVRPSNTEAARSAEQAAR